MKVQEIVIRNFRNIPELRISPNKHLNFFIGDNGQGKTSILEAISYLSTLRSFRGAKSDEVIRFNEPWAEISCSAGEGDWSTSLKVTFSQANERATKTAFIDGKPIRSSTQYLSSRFGQVELGFHSIVFNPADHDLIRGEPSGRRQYLDRALSAEDPAYLKALSKYSKFLEQRNALLKEERRVSQDVLEGFTAPLIEQGAEITRLRVDWLNRLNEKLNETLRKIVDSPLELRAFFKSSWIDKKQVNSNTSDQIDPGHFSLQSRATLIDFLRNSFRESLQSRSDAEWRAGSTLVGPHRDDFELVFGNQALKGHGSQGEVRSALIALKLCEIDLFRKKTGHRPILLLDDFSSELDRNRRQFLLKHLSDTDLQVFVTSTEEPPHEGATFRLRGGAITE